MKIIPERAEEFKAALNAASFHFADDTGREWPQAARHIELAAEIAIIDNWRSWQIINQHSAASSLVPFDTLLQEILNKLRKI